MKLYKHLVVITSLLMTANLSLADAALDLADKLAKVTSMQASFKQTIVDADGALMQQSEGVIAVKQPQQLYWHTTAPYQHMVITNGQSLWLYDIDLEQASQEPFSGDLAQTPALLLSGDASRIANTYHVTAEQQGYQLLPIHSDGLFSALHLRFNGAYIDAMTLEDSFGQRTTIELSDIIINPEIDNKRFEFIAPEGIDVINNES